MTIGTAVALAGAMLLAAASPGPDFLLVMRASTTHGRIAGVYCALGIGVGVAAWALVASAGLAGLLAASTVAFTIVTWLGAGYLIYLGGRAIVRGWAVRRDASSLESASRQRALGRGGAFAQGFVTNILNPKSAVFFVALLPQFMPPAVDVGSVLALCSIGAGVAIVWFSALALTIGSVARLFRTARCQSVFDLASGSVLVGLGVRVATTAT